MPKYAFAADEQKNMGIEAKSDSGYRTMVYSSCSVTFRPPKSESWPAGSRGRPTLWPACPQGTPISPGPRS